MINYTDHLSLLMRDVIARVPTLSFIDVRDLLVFARFGRSGAAGAFATCHCLNLPESEPGYYFWRDRSTGRVTRRTEWFVTKSPTVTVDARRVKYLISFTLPRFCDQSLSRSRKSRYYHRSTPSWIAKLDTVVHELYHIDPAHNGIRRIDRPDGSCSPSCHGPTFFSDVARMVDEYLDSKPDAGILDFLKHDFDALTSRHGGIVGTTFRPFPSYPQRFVERLEQQPPCSDDIAGIDVEPWRSRSRQTEFTVDDLHIRQFFPVTSRSVSAKRQIQAA
jgi:hypothetical protein